MKEVLTKDISRIWYQGDYYSKMYKGNKLVWPPDYLRHESIEINFNQKTGEFGVGYDAGFVEYLLENTTIYCAKCREDGSVIVIPLWSEPDYETGNMKFTGDKLGVGTTNRDVYYRIDKSKSIYTTSSTIDF